ncbi:MAG: plasmid mobilization protein [Staphylococcus equorum]
MPNQDQKKAKTINVSLTEEEYEKVRALAQIRDLNPTAYTRLTALGNRIKPTVIEVPNEEGKDKDTNEIERLKTQIKENEQYLELFKHLLKHINDNGYIDFNSYKADRKLLENIKKIKNIN